jgi:hypothetical protein
MALHGTKGGMSDVEASGHSFQGGFWGRAGQMRHIPYLLKGITLSGSVTVGPPVRGKRGSGRASTAHILAAVDASTR